ncbi:MAG: transaldolase [Dehalococcoidia bacterium]|nr:transaldolase [Dehalococcoidia bacterium]
MLELYQAGQSPWLDMIERRLLHSGELRRMIEEEGLRGLTSNPTIFEKSISRGKEYEADIQRLAAEGKNAFEIYEELSTVDIQEACDAFHSVYVQSEGEDGYVSLEPPSQYAYDLEKTLTEVSHLFRKVGTPNVMIKVPGTAEGVDALRELIASGININVTLLFSLSNYSRVARSYIEGLEKRARQGKDLSRLASVASVFVSRIDTAVDKRLGELLQQEKDASRRKRLEGLLGQAAVANAKLIYQKYREMFDSADFRALASKGARPQRLLWGSTSTKNPAYSDLKYVNELIGTGTINTLPPETWKAFLDHGTVKQTVSQGVAEARQVLKELDSVGISLEQVCDSLQKDGVKAFADSLDSLLKTLEDRRQMALAVKAGEER